MAGNKSDKLELNNVIWYNFQKNTCGEIFMNPNVQHKHENGINKIESGLVAVGCDV